ncbi:hypothetical protein [Nevskia ramosa]|uniref:hypothetical protein n=1 Tax=Nevskia ramosa TaxID=64002 RepID=UPI0003F8B36A|nr:hypothetical protein [Nevskia ramosa]
MDADPITEITLMADYGACIWDQSFAAIWLDELGWPEALEQRIDDWERHFWLRLDEPEKFDPVYLDAEGRLIALEIKALVGADIRVIHKTFNHDLLVIDG